MPRKNKKTNLKTNKMTKTDKKYVEILKAILQEKKVWERNDLLDAFRRKLKPEYKDSAIQAQR